MEEIVEESTEYFLKVYLTIYMHNDPSQRYAILMGMWVEVSKGFLLEKSVCNHGFFMMAPNRWDPSTKTLVRPLRLPDHSSVTVSISQPYKTLLLITILDELDNPSSDSRQVIEDQVKRMLRVSDVEEKQLKEFHRLHRDAAKRGFGHLFRSPSLFEDIVKSLILCCCTFNQTLEMAEELCILQTRIDLKRGEVRKGKRGKRKRCREDSWGNFPSAQELAILKDESLLRTNCKLGYRASAVLSLAKNVTKGEIILQDFEKSCDVNDLFPKLMRINWFGEFVSSNVLMCMGFYNRIPCDSETERHIQQIHQRKDCHDKNVMVIAKEIYDKYAPFQTLAYWLELVDFYESKLGKLSQLDRSLYKKAAGSMIDKPI